MELKRIGANASVLTLGNGTKILFSYETPVAVKVAGGETLKTARFHSRTTSRHITEWLDDGCAESVREVKQEVIDALVKEAH